LTYSGPANFTSSARMRSIPGAVLFLNLLIACSISFIVGTGSSV
jgi:hypothetical protein